MIEINDQRVYECQQGMLCMMVPAGTLAYACVIRPAAPVILCIKSHYKID